VAKHRFFVFLDAGIIPESRLMVIALDDAYYLGVLSSRIHALWSLKVGARHEDRPTYNNTLCFTPFPFPDATPEQEARIRGLGEKLDAHRKARQALHPDLTMTGMYNVLEALRQGRELTTKEKTIHEQGLVTVLRELHDDLDASVAEAYGWPVDLPDEEILARLAALNAERAAEEKQGKIRWLRPEYQSIPKAERGAMQATFDIEFTPKTAPKGKKGKAAKAKAEAKRVWPADLLEQTQAVRGVVDALRGAPVSITLDAVAEQFTRAPGPGCRKFCGPWKH
jgi:hypothetical protein